MSGNIRNKNEKDEKCRLFWYDEHIQLLFCQESAVVPVVSSFAAF